MKIGVLQTGLVASELVQETGEYDAVFRRFLQNSDPEVEVTGWEVVNGDIPSDPFAADGWIISGSKHGVYEDHAWLPPLKSFIRDCARHKVPMVGICFGHQVMAEALGGKAEKSEKGWGLGPHQYQVVSRPDWMANTPEKLTIQAVHQDQVTALPPGACLFATSTFCENAGLLYGDPDAPYAISLQPHPEFSRDFAEGLINIRRGNAFPEPESATAIANGGMPLHNDWAAQWILTFLRKSLPNF